MVSREYLNRQIGVEVVASCGNCYAAPPSSKIRRDNLERVRGRLTELADSRLHLGSDLEFIERALEACNGGDYSYPKVLDLINEALGPKE